MTRSTIIRSLKRAILRRVSDDERPEARGLLAALEDQYSALMSTVQQDAYQDGVRDERKRHEASQSSGFDLGYKHGLEQALGRIGQPARRVDDEDLPLPVS